MTRHSDLTPSTSTKRRAEALGVDPGVMDAIDALGPKLSLEKWRELATFAGRPVEDVMMDELVPSRGLGMQAWEGGEADDPSTSAPPKDAFEGHMRDVASRGAAHGQNGSGEPSERAYEEACDKYGPLMCQPWDEVDEAAEEWW